MQKIILSLLLVISFITPFGVYAVGEEVVLTPKQEEILLNLVGALTEPPEVLLTAHLTPPDTFYSFVISPNFQKLLNDTNQKLQKEGMILYFEPGEEEIFEAKIGSCGTWNDGGLDAPFWHHPEELCPHGNTTNHPGTIKVTDGFLEMSVETVKGEEVFYGLWDFTCTYEGSESGQDRCEVKLGEWRGRYGEQMQGQISKGGSGGMSPFVYIAIALILFGGYYWYMKNSGKAKQKGPCEEEKENEARARRDKDNAEKKFKEIDEAKKARDEADKKARDREEKADKARKSAGTRWSASGSTDWEGEHTELHREGWHDKEAGAKADQATSEAEQARASANDAKAKFDNMGGDSGWSNAKSEMDNANDEWQKADQALKVCLNSFSAPAPAPTNTPSDPATPPPTTPAPTPSPTPPISIPTNPPQTQSRICQNGDRRNERVESVTVQILNLESVRLMQDKIYSDAGNEAMKFVDYLQTLKDLFMLGKRIKGGVTAYTGGSVTGAADGAGLPDFLTWYDKGIDALTKSMNQLYEIMQDKQRLGEYWLEYQTKTLTITCTRREVCVENNWVKRCELSIEDGAVSTHRTDAQSVHDVRELRGAITRLFTQLRNRYTPDKNRAKEFTSTCR